ncbi:hypothetical protein WR25_25828 [Diploscapter pachys]|uniref:Uncharacterized protein n=1 Tax=Diploscapter pachys TaxID=2018661 RepID=A0A2A2JLX6_9BILA|nr:hypothetical protein WR25_25828 [Diploscapter pachys]
MAFCWSCAIFWGLVAVGLYLLRRFIKGAQFTEAVSGVGKIAAVTGANSGIGLETARELNLRGFKVYLLCRSKSKADEAIASLVATSGCDKKRLIYVPCDLSSLKSVYMAAEFIQEREDKVDLLICNAGCAWIETFTLTDDGHEYTWESNYLSHFLLIELLLKLMKESDSARIVNVSSCLHLLCKEIDLKTIDTKEAYPSHIMSFSRYNETKFAQVAHTRELAERLKSSGIKNITVNALHPGTVDTNISRNLPFLNNPVAQFIKDWIQKLFMRTANDGCQTTLYVSLSSELKDVSGRYFDNCALASENIKTLDSKFAEELYTYSMNAIKPFL